MVESQHVAATMKLVDTRDEQDLLETLLETSKPSQPEETTGLDYLLATPFRYAPLPGGSRFRGVNDPGVFYAAESERTAAAELGYWRWRFLRDSEDLDHIEPVAHTAFQVEVDTLAIDLQRKPFDADTKVWVHPTDYGPTQQFARLVREADVGVILYRSVRDPQPAWCLALLTPKGFAKKTPQGTRHNWFLAVTKNEVTWRRDTESIQFPASTWA